MSLAVVFASSRKRKRQLWIRLFIRILGLALLAGAFAAWGDLMAPVLGSPTASRCPTRWRVTAYWAFPNKFPLLQLFIERQIHPLLRDPLILLHLLAAVPTWLVLGLIWRWAVSIRRGADGRRRSAIRTGRVEAECHLPKAGCELIESRRNVIPVSLLRHCSHAGHSFHL